MSAHKKLQNLEQQLSQALVEPVHHPLLEEKDIQLFLKREDRLHPIVSGNKWRKLKYILQHAIEKDHDHLISMGGLWSNHLHALAWAGKELGLRTTGIIRGELPDTKSSTLIDIESWGMQLEFVNRIRFRKLREFHEYNSEPVDHYKGYWIPEGGANKLALRGVAEMINEINVPFDMITLACGTGTTLAGVASALPADKKVIGFAALKGAGFLQNDVNNLLNDHGQKNWSINLDYHFGGFAKTDQNLFSFIKDFEKQTEIPLEPVYTGKMMYGLFDLIKQGMFESGQKIIAIHTGGLQGKSGFQI